MSLEQYTDVTVNYHMATASIQLKLYTDSPRHSPSNKDAAQWCLNALNQGYHLLVDLLYILQKHASAPPKQEQIHLPDIK
jgi:hypothetical protein